MSVCEMNRSTTNQQTLIINPFNDSVHILQDDMHFEAWLNKDVSKCGAHWSSKKIDSVSARSGR